MLLASAPTVAAPTVIYEASVPMVAIDAALGAGLFDLFDFTASRFVIRIEAQLAPLSSFPAFDSIAPFEAGDGVNGFGPGFLPGQFEAEVITRGVSTSSGTPVSKTRGSLSEDLSTDSSGVAVVEDLFNGAAPTDAPALLRAARFGFFVAIDPLTVEDFEVNFLHASNEVLAASPFLGAAPFLRLERLNRGLTFETSDFDLRLVEFRPDGVVPGQAVPEPASLALVGAALGLMAGVTRRQRQAG